MAEGTRRALITGITGQDGSYLAELLLEKGYAVHGIKRRASSFNTSRIDHLYQDPHELSAHGQPPRLTLHYGDLSDGSNLQRIIEQVQPNEIYNLGAQSHVAVSFDAPEYTCKRGCSRHSKNLGSRANSWSHAKVPDLPSFHIRTLRPGAGDPAKRTNTLSPAQSLWSSQALRLLDHRELPRGLRHVCLQWNTF